MPSARLQDNLLGATIQNPLALMHRHLEVATGRAIEGDELLPVIYSMACNCNIKVYDASSGNMFREIKTPAEAGQHLPTLELIYAVPGPGTPIYDNNFREIARRTGGHYDALRPQLAQGNGLLSGRDKH